MFPFLCQECAMITMTNMPPMFPFQCQECAMRRTINMPSPTLPPGFRIIFDPTDEQIILDYLLKKVLGKPLPSDYIIECDLYGDSKTWKKFFEEKGQNTLYFFTKLKKKTNKGSRIERVTDCGTWKCQKDIPISSFRTNEIKQIGSRRNFSLVWKKGLEESVHKEKGISWVMHEYRLDGCLLGKKANNNMDDYVVCRINKRKKKEDEEVTTQEAAPMASFSDDIGCFWDMGNTGNMNQVDVPDVAWNAPENFVSTELMNVNDGRMSYIEWDSNLCMSLEDLEDHQPLNFTINNAVMEQAVAPPQPGLISDHQGQAEKLQPMHQHQQLIQYNIGEDIRHTTTRRQKLDPRPTGFASGVKYSEATWEEF